MILSEYDIARSVLSSLLHCDMSPYCEQLKNFKIEPRYFTHPVHNAVAKAIEKLQAKGYPPFDAYVQELLSVESSEEYVKSEYIEILAANPYTTTKELQRIYTILKRRHATRLLKVLR